MAISHMTACGRSGPTLPPCRLFTVRWRPCWAAPVSWASSPCWTRSWPHYYNDITMMSSWCTSFSTCRDHPWRRSWGGLTWRPFVCSLEWYGSCTASGAVTRTFLIVIFSNSRTDDVGSNFLSDGILRLLSSQGWLYLYTGYQFVPVIL